MIRELRDHTEEVVELCVNIWGNRLVETKPMVKQASF